METITKVILVKIRPSQAYLLSKQCKAQVLNVWVWRGVKENIVSHFPELYVTPLLLYSFTVP